MPSVHLCSGCSWVERVPFSLTFSVYCYRKCSCIVVLYCTTCTAVYVVGPRAAGRADPASRARSLVTECGPGSYTLQPPAAPRWKETTSGDAPAVAIKRTYTTSRRTDSTVGGRSRRAVPRHAAGASDPGRSIETIRPGDGVCAASPPLLPVISPHTIDSSSRRRSSSLTRTMSQWRAAQSAVSRGSARQCVWLC
jgi:hypothetical protein